MKKTFAIVLALCLLTVTLTACGPQQAETTPTPTQTQPTESVQPTEEPGNETETPSAQRGPAPEVTEGSKYTFVYEGAKLPMNQEFSALLEWLGEPESYFEAASCAFDGLDKFYTYPGFELTTYPVGEQDFISEIYFTSADLTTPEGVGPGDTYEDMVAAYGEEYTESFGQYTYTDGDTMLIITIENDAIFSVSYLAINDQIG